MAETRCGLVALVGAPNVGKSTLLNALVGEKVGIVSPKPNTTRVVVRGVATAGNAQVVFVDTPGLNQSKTGLERALIQQARGSLEEADVVALLIDAAKGFDEKAKTVMAGLKKGKQAAVLVINKVDKLKPRAKVLELMTQAQEAGIFKEVFAISASSGGGVRDVLPRIAKLLPEGPWLFPAGQTTDMPVPLRLAEITRAQVMKLMHDEVPYGVAVLPGGIDDSGKPWLVTQTVVVGREAHKGMVVGAKGQMLKAIGTGARQEMQEILGKGVRLELTVEVREGWAERLDMLNQLGISHG